MCDVCLFMNTSLLVLAVVYFLGRRGGCHFEKERESVEAWKDHLPWRARFIYM